MERQLGDNDPTTTITETVDAPVEQEPGTSQSAPVLRLRLEKPQNERRVAFHQGIIDNEHLNRKKSKCCCIYRKPLAFGESSSEDDEDCEHCFGHPELKRKNRKHHDHDGEPHHDHDGDACPLANNETATIIRTPSAEKIASTEQSPTALPIGEETQSDRLLK